MPTFQDKQQYTPIDSAKTEQNNLHKFFNKLLSLVVIIVLVLFSYFTYLVISTSGQVFQSDATASCTSWFCNIQNGIANVPKIFSSDVKIKGQDLGRTNFLLVGKDKSGLGLTDTIIVVSLFHTQKKIVTLNIPRDFLINYYGNQFKINSLYSTVEAEKPGSGMKELSSFLGREFGINIDYWAQTDFNGVKKVVNTLGNIEVNVDKTFTDCEFPDENYDYLPCQTFNAGLQNMTGEKALIYARSRHGNNGEGSDFARSNRQSKVVQSILQKVKTQNLFENVVRGNDFIKILGESVKTNIDPAELKTLYNVTKQIDLKSNYLKVNWSVGNGILCDSSSADGYYISYCGGEVAGSRQTPGKARSKAQRVVQNLIAEAESKQITDSQLFILGNGSKAAPKIFDQFELLGFEKIGIDNQYNKIPVTPTPEKVSILVKDPRLEPFIKTALGSSIKYQIVESLNPSIVIPTKASNADVLIVVE
jgi:polyisoprenyl-teichoic acid--peptidoglycan teichoic acid transferase